MSIQKKRNGIVIDIEARPNSGKEKIEHAGDRIKVHIKAPAEKGKANIAIIKLFSKLGSCQILSGLTSKKKRIYIETDEEKLKEFIASKS
jgi:uncharacterized protein (TIGR00251 family)